MSEALLDVSTKLESEVVGEIVDGMDRAEAGANEEWKQAFDEIVEYVARRKETFTVDDLLDEIDLREDFPTTRTLAAIGPRMLKAAKAGLIETTGELARSKRASKHGIHRPIWRSLIHGVQA